ncbi:MAG: hypothetical protein ACD_3C00081G0003 [uncultured bacterium (gcode 4)]|uniref:Uncharacterized protein n=1 Tax=uncultured bacterium (gcode 4) TaxID=1234023 RepID=K2FB03_9BACT|nr:MAG: hypothetical protein ACD_3C00081G0003 [uncultured bacterium (gcode 4)]
MFELKTLEQYKYFYPDEIDNFSDNDIIEKLFFDDIVVRDELLSQLNIADWPELDNLRNNLIDLNLKLFHHYSDYIHKHSLLVEDLSREMETEKKNTLLEKEILEKEKEIEVLEDVLF